MEEATKAVTPASAQIVSKQGVIGFLAGTVVGGIVTFVATKILKKPVKPVETEDAEEGYTEA